MAAQPSYSAYQSGTSQSTRRVFKGLAGVNFYQKEGQLVMISGVDSNNKGTVDLCDATGNIPIGVIEAGYASSKTTSDDVQVVMLAGFTYRAIAAAAITAGARVCANVGTDGKVKTAVSSEYVVGVALNTAAAGDLVEIVPIPLVVVA